MGVVPSQFTRLKPAQAAFLNRPQDFKDESYNTILGQSLNNVNIQREDLHKRGKTHRSLLDDDEAPHFGTAQFDSVSSIQSPHTAAGPGLN